MRHSCINDIIAGDRGECQPKVLADADCGKHGSQDGSHERGCSNVGEDREILESTTAREPVDVRTGRKTSASSHQLQ